MLFRNAAPRIAADEHEWHAALDQHIDHRRNRLAVEIDVEDRDVEFGLFGDAQRFVEPAGLGRHGVADVGEHVVQQQTDHRFVLDHEDAPARI